MTNLNDSGPGSLRNALSLANNAEGDDVITFSPGLSGSIVLGGTQLEISSNITLQGPSEAPISINGNQASRVLLMKSGTVKISNLTITGGKIGGGGYIDGPNDGGGIRQNGGQLTLENCTISDNTVSNGFGGGMIRYGGSTVFRECTIANNRAIGDPGTAGDGGGLDFEFGSSTFEDCTIANNSAGGNAGGIYINQTVVASFKNCIIATNKAANNPDIFGAAVSNGHNFLGIQTTTDFNGVNDRFGRGTPLDPSFVTTTAGTPFLAENGGPTRTIALTPGSLARDAGDSESSTDQRGQVRPDGPADDIGAYEGFSLLPGPVIVTTLVDENNGSPNQNLGTGTSFREAIDYANSNPDATSIFFDLPSGSRVITLTSPLPILRYTLSITGPTVGGVTVARNDAPGAQPFTIFISTGQLNITNLTISGGKSNDAPAGGIGNFNGQLTLTNCTISSNTGVGSGIYSSTGADSSTTFTVLRNCTVTGNTSSSTGLGGSGAVMVAAGKTVIQSTTIVGNFAASNNSAGLLASKSSGSTRVEIANSIIAGNLASGASPSSAADVGFPVNPVDGVLVSSGYNLIGDGNGADQFSAPGDQVGVADANLKLGALSDNGGPTKTIALLPGSPAVDAGNPAFNGNGLTDQRGLGFPRVLRGRLDIGAFELRNTPPILGAASFTFTQGQSISGAQLTGTDIDGDQLSYSAEDGLPAGIILNANGTFSGTPTVATNGTNVTVTVSDSKGGSSNTVITIKVLDKVAPFVFISTPTNNQNLSIPAFNNISGTATDNLNVAQVLIKLFRTRNGVTTFWNGTSFGSAQVQIPVTLTSSGATSTQWSFEISTALRSALDVGVYSVAAYGKDSAGNISGAVGRNFNLIVDNAAPTPVISTPTQNQDLPTPSFNAITGTATDNVGVTQVLIKLFRTRNGQTSFWNGSSFGASQVQLPATLTSSGSTSTGWTFPITNELRGALDDGPYLIAAYAKDAAGNTSGAVGRSFALHSDIGIPAVIITSPTQNQTLLINSFSNVTGSASDNVGVSQVLIKLFRTRNGVTSFWNGTSFGAQQVLLPATLNSAGAPSTTWSFTVSPELSAAFDSGAYALVAYAKDAAGNQSPAYGRNFTLSSSSTLLSPKPSGSSF